MFCKAVLVSLAAAAGHQQSHRDFIAAPLTPAGGAQGIAHNMWSNFDTIAKDMKDEVPRCAAGSVIKRSYTAGSHVLANHFFCWAFANLQQTPEPLLRRLLAGEDAALQDIRDRPLPAGFFDIPAACMLAAPRHSHMMAQNVVTIFNEMQLPESLRAGAAVAMEGARAGGGTGPSQRAVGKLLDPDEEIIGRMLRKYITDGKVTVTKAGKLLSSRDRSVERVRSVFVKASALGAGHIVDEAASSRSGHTMHFQIDLGNMDTSVRQRLGLDAPMSVGLGQDQIAQPLPCPSPPPPPFVNLGKGMCLPSPPPPPPELHALPPAFP